MARANLFSVWYLAILSESLESCPNCEAHNDIMFNCPVFVRISGVITRRMLSLTRSLSDNLNSQLDELSIPSLSSVRSTSQAYVDQRLAVARELINDIHNPELTENAMHKLAQVSSFLYLFCFLIDAN